MRLLFTAPLESFMKIHYLQHVPFETPAAILEWAKEHKHKITGHHLYKGDKLPTPSEIDMLIVMGGPMGVYDDRKFPFLKEEKVLIQKLIPTKKKILGICLGAQILASVLGAVVKKNRFKEIGFFPVTRSQNALNSPFGALLPESFTPFHWHGDAFDIPKEAVHLAQSVACRSQAFSYGENVLGIQFHLESTPESIEALITNCRSELTPSEYIRSESSIKQGYSFLEENTKVLYGLLDGFTAKVLTPKG
jgi:GMP synthase-like glutamine amidotransferase